MDAFLLVAIVLVLGLAVAPMFLMRGQWGKKKDPEGDEGGGVLNSDHVQTGARSATRGDYGGADGGGGDGGGD